MGKPISSYEALVDHINRLNAEWVAALRRVSPKVIVDLLEPVGSKLAALVAALDPSGTAAVAVAWAGEEQSRVWLDIGREYTEHWHHQDQIREAAGAAPLRDARWLKPVLDISMWALPHAYRDVASETGKSVLLVAEGEGGGTWTLVREPAGWTLWTGRESDPSCRILMEALTMARLLLHRLNPEDVRGQVQVEGDGALAEPFMRARAVMV